MVARERKFLNSQHNVYHQDAIKLLIIHQLGKFNHGWEQFLLSSEFVTLKNLATPPEVVKTTSVKMESTELYDTREIGSSSIESCVKTRSKIPTIRKREVKMEHDNFVSKKLQFSSQNK